MTEHLGTLYRPRSSFSIGWRQYIQKINYFSVERSFIDSLIGSNWLFSVVGETQKMSDAYSPYS